MSISSALSNAASGLSVSGRLADTISNNVSNAMTPGFGRRVTEVSSLALGGYGSGARISGTARTENPFLTAERRGMDASLGAAGTLSDAFERLMATLGEPGSATALATRATALETALMSATASPQSQTVLAAAVDAAGRVADAVNGIAAETQRLRTETDAEINRQVGQVNAALEAVSDLNAKIVTLSLRGQDISALQDERDRVIDGIAAVIPVRAVNRENGQVALYSANGGALIDGRTWPLSFTPGPTIITPEMSLGAPLSPLMQDQGAASGPVAIDAGSGRGPMDGGSLGALFDLRDRVLPDYDAEIDRYARDLIDRFSTPALAGALDGTGQGLFVDATPGPMVGLAQRLSLNAAVDPAQGGEVFRLRDGLAAAAPGFEGYGGILQGLSDAMAEKRPPLGFVSQNAANGAAGMAMEIASFFAGQAARADDARAYLTARQTTLADSEANAIGVDTDAELQTLILVEQTYAANARVLSVIDGLMKLLLEG
jgi:flagellar hook-associated protein 1